MQEKRTPVFQNEDGSWGHVTQTVNPLICTIEYSYHTGFPSKKEAEESYQKSQDAYSNQIQQLKNPGRSRLPFLNIWTTGSVKSTPLIPPAKVPYSNTAGSCTRSSFHIFRMTFSWTVSAKNS